LSYEFEKQGLPVQRQVLMPLRYEDLIIDKGYRVDLLVGDSVVVELQLLSCLRLGRFKLGYLLNFNVARMRDGIVRLVNGP
jgi:GxxExxY protein